MRPGAKVQGGGLYSNRTSPPFCNPQAEPYNEISASANPETQKEMRQLGNGKLKP